MNSILNAPVAISSLSLSFHPWMLTAIFVVFLVFYISLSAVLYYHWIKYGLGTRAMHIAEFVYALGSVVFLYTAVLGLGTL